jgi:hypothetical protein
VTAVLDPILPDEPDGDFFSRALASPIFGGRWSWNDCRIGERPEILPHRHVVEPGQVALEEEETGQIMGGSLCQWVLRPPNDP